MYSVQLLGVFVKQAVCRRTLYFLQSSDLVALKFLKGTEVSGRRKEQ
jgi:hypothetical protein